MPADPGNAFIVGLLFGAGSAWTVGLLILRLAGVIGPVARRHEAWGIEHDWFRRRK